MPSIASDGIHVTAVTDFSILMPTLLIGFRESLPLSSIDLDFDGRLPGFSKSKARGEIRSEKAPARNRGWDRVRADRAGGCGRNGRRAVAGDPGEHGEPRGGGHRPGWSA